MIPHNGHVNTQGIAWGLYAIKPLFKPVLIFLMMNETQNLEKYLAVITWKFKNFLQENAPHIITKAAIILIQGGLR